MPAGASKPTKAIARNVLGTARGVLDCEDRRESGHARATAAWSCAPPARLAEDGAVARLFHGAAHRCRGTPGDREPQPVAGDRRHSVRSRRLRRCETAAAQPHRLDSARAHTRVSPVGRRWELRRPVLPPRRSRAAPPPDRRVSRGVVDLAALAPAAAHRTLPRRAPVAALALGVPDLLRGLRDRYRRHAPGRTQPGLPPGTSAWTRTAGWCPAAARAVRSSTSRGLCSTSRSAQRVSGGRLSATGARRASIASS